MESWDRIDGVDGGTYTLLVDLDVDEPTATTFRAAGERELPAGRYAYTGSALGPGGFARVDRHRQVAVGAHDVRHWHVDYLLGDPCARLVHGVRSTGVDAECDRAGRRRTGDSLRVRRRRRRERLRLFEPPGGRPRRDGAGPGRSTGRRPGAGVTRSKP